MRRLAPLLIDLALIIGFALIGRRNHDEGAAVAATLTVAAPFLIGYAVAAGILRLDRSPLAIGRGALVAVIGVALGLALRGSMFDRGLAPAFIVVAFTTITALLVGWRLVAGRLAGSGVRNADARS